MYRIVGRITLMFSMVLFFIFQCGFYTEPHEKYFYTLLGLFWFYFVIWSSKSIQLTFHNKMLISALSVFVVGFVPHRLRLFEFSVYELQLQNIFLDIVFLLFHFLCIYIFLAYSNKGDRGH
jgi:hypothetical protein